MCPRHRPRNAAPPPPAPGNGWGGRLRRRAGDDRPAVGCRSPTAIGARRETVRQLLLWRFRKWVRAKPQEPAVALPQPTLTESDVPSAFVGQVNIFTLPSA
ncbi:hypothetical protein SUDANB37_04847 [Streptomyces sp. enrichment culture]